MTGTIVKKVKGLDFANLNQTEEITNKVITNEPFFPNINFDDARNAMRLEGNISNDRLEQAVVEAMIYVNDELRTWQTTQEVSTLEETSAPTINGEQVNVTRYKRAVYCYTTANLTERYFSYDATNQTDENAENKKLTVDRLYRDCTYAIKDILGKPRAYARTI